MPLVVDFHFNDGSHIGEETAMNGDAHAGALAGFRFAPAWLSRRRVRRRAADARCRRDISSPTPAATLRAHIEHAAGPDQSEQIIVGVAVGIMCEFIGEGLHSERVINIRHRPQPADAHMRRRLPILRCGSLEHRTERTYHPMDISPAPPYTSPSLKVDPMGGKTDRCSHAFGLPLSSTAAFRYIAATEW